MYLYLTALLVGRAADGGGVRRRHGSVHPLLRRAHAVVQPETGACQKVHGHAEAPDGHAQTTAREWMSLRRASLQTATEWVGYRMGEEGMRWEEWCGVGPGWMSCEIVLVWGRFLD